MDISVITPVYNAVNFIRKAVESAVVLPQVKEIILVDDGSTDGSLDMCQTLQKEYKIVRLLTHPNNTNLGAGASRNMALRHAKMPYVAFLDADDIYLPNRFDLDEKIARDNPDVEVFCNAIGAYIIETNEVIDHQKTSNLRHYTTINRHVPNAELADVIFNIHPKAQGYFSVDGITIKSICLEKIGYFNTKLRLHQDTEWLYRLFSTSVAQCSSIIEPVALRGLHENNRIFKSTSFETRMLMYDSAITSLTSLNAPKIYIMRLQAEMALKRIKKANLSPRNFIIIAKYFVHYFFRR